eukprot:CAMPEP_0118669868 /NCGR_PEP_ID=MMETSP0785-20121206/21139_1 /TAXON_ID=91992 /ORGANISM="Bolidomonas pacifica, Strain CCMP 1866" /LENGTH=205 /DNA_ID=CAMNT_0006564597 /DNA_START=92 /DNA_END=705 /DNA_ORIENTATION=+
MRRSFRIGDHVNVSGSMNPDGYQYEAKILDVDDAGNFYQVKWSVAGYLDWVEAARVHPLVTESSGGRSRRSRSRNASAEAKGGIKVEKMKKKATKKVTQKLSKPPAAPKSKVKAAPKSKQSKAAPKSKPAKAPSLPSIPPPVAAASFEIGHASPSISNSASSLAECPDSNFSHSSIRSSSQECEVWIASSLDNASPPPPPKAASP